MSREVCQLTIQVFVEDNLFVSETCDTSRVISDEHDSCALFLQLLDRSVGDESDSGSYHCTVSFACNVDKLDVTQGGKRSIDSVLGCS